MSSMQLNSIEACLFRQLNTFLKLILKSPNIFQGHLLRNGKLFAPNIPYGFPDCYSRGSPNLFIVVFEGMRASACVEDLQEEDASLGMYCINNQLPSFHLLSIIERGGSQEPIPPLTPRCCLSQNQSCSCSLSIILGNQRIRDIRVDIASLSSECSHEYSIFQGQRSQGNRVIPILLH